jgi:hypothetical protein
MKKGKDNRKKTGNQVADPNKKELMAECRNTEDIDVIL